VGAYVGGGSVKVFAMARTRPTSGDSVRRRPKDRKAQIARASAEAFSALGYYGVSMEAIASRVGISAAALYRHYSSKYELFRDAVLSLGQQLVDCTAFAADDTAPDDPEQILRNLVSALIDTAMANRESGGLYRWEGRYLRGDDQATLIAQMRTVHRRIQQPLMRIRPELTARQRWTLSTAALSVIGSIVDHRAKLPAIVVRALLAELADAVLAAELPDVQDAVVVPGPSGITAEASKYEALLSESMQLFNRKGYRDTSVEDIATAVGMPASGIYKYFSGKSDILAAAFRRAADRLSAELTAIVDTVPDRVDALTTVIDTYMRRSFEQPELDYVYYSERLNMTAADQKILRNLQRSTVESWVELVVSVRPEWTPGQARFAVHAAMSLVIDLGRLMRYQNSAQTRATVERLLDLTLLGRYRLRATLPAK
jgi:AcrR family transcriptional regulator